jgi:hypothetical protein
MYACIITTKPNETSAFASTQHSCGSQTPQHSFKAIAVSKNWSHQGVLAQEFYPTLVLFSEESLFHFCGYVNCQNNV